MKTICFVLAVITFGYLFPSSAEIIRTDSVAINKTSKPVEEGTKIKFTIGSKTYDIQNYSLSYYSYNRNNDAVISPPNIYLANTLSVSLRTSKVDPELLNWILDVNQQPKNGQIVVYDSDSGKTLRTITLTGITTASYFENNNINGYVGNNQVTTFGLRYKTVEVKF